jgi:rhamnogalacturonan endolyase
MKLEKVTLWLCLPVWVTLCPAEDIVSAPVTVREDQAGFLLANGLVSAWVEKSHGQLVSLKYHGQELLGHGGGYWTFAGRVNGNPRGQTLLRVDPATNGGTRAEVVCRFPVAANDSAQNLSAEYRYALGQGASGVYATAVFSHEPGHAAFGAGEGRFVMKLNPQVFDYLTVDANRRRVMPSGFDWDHGSPLNMKEARRMTTGVHKGEVEHKYDYSAVLAETPAYGWSSSEKHLGLWLVNPSTEYLGGGPTKAELTGHLDVNAGGLPTLLNMWLGSHYGGTVLQVAPGEAWTKVVGPFLIYCNAASSHEALWRDALAQAAKETAAWPYFWAADDDFPPESQRGTVNGQPTSQISIHTSGPPVQQP